MPFYPFLNKKTGEVVELYMHMRNAVPIGAETLHEGVIHERLPSDFHGSEQWKRMNEGWPRVSEALPRGYDIGCERDEKGRQVFRTKRQEENCLKILKEKYGEEYVRE